MTREERFIPQRALPPPPRICLAWLRSIRTPSSTLPPTDGEKRKGKTKTVILKEKNCIYSRHPVQQCQITVYSSPGPGMTLKHINSDKSILNNYLEINTLSQT